MQVTETKIDELTREFRVAVPAADIESKFEKRLGELAHSVRLPGFRPGKVPVPLLRKRYGETLRGEILEETINEATKSVIADRGIRPATPPRIEIAPAAAVHQPVIRPRFARDGDERGHAALASSRVC